jgi:hypothetical protein
MFRRLFDFWASASGHSSGWNSPHLRFGSESIPSSDIFMHADSDLDRREHSRGAFAWRFEISSGLWAVLTRWSRYCLQFWNFIRMDNLLICGIEFGSDRTRETKREVTPHPRLTGNTIFYKDKGQLFVAKPWDDLESISTFDTIIRMSRAHSSLRTELKW